MIQLALVYGHGVASYGLGLLIAVLAALLFAVGSVFQHEQASAVAMGSGHASVKALLRRPIWVIAQGATAAAVGAQVVALALAPVAVVQPVLAGGLIFALGLRCIRDRSWPPLIQVLGALATAVGLAVFLTTARPVGGAYQIVPGVLEVLIAVGLTMVVVLFARVESKSAPVFLGAAAGLAVGIAAVLISSALKTLSEHGLVHTLTSPALWGAIAVACMAQYASMLAFARGSLSLSLPALTVVDPLAAVAAARILTGERLRQGNAEVWIPAGILAAIGAAIVTRSWD